MDKLKKSGFIFHFYKHSHFPLFITECPRQCSSLYQCSWHIHGPSCHVHPIPFPFSLRSYCSVLKPLIASTFEHEQLQDEWLSTGSTKCRNDDNRNAPIRPIPAGLVLVLDVTQEVAKPRAHEELFWTTRPVSVPFVPRRYQLEAPLPVSAKHVSHPLAGLTYTSVLVLLKAPCVTQPNWPREPQR